LFSQKKIRAANGAGPAAGSGVAGSEGVETLGGKRKRWESRQRPEFCAGCSDRNSVSSTTWDGEVRF